VIQRAGANHKRRNALIRRGLQSARNIAASSDGFISPPRRPTLHRRFRAGTVPLTQNRNGTVMQPH
jgi:hypothetical protein